MSGDNNNLPPASDEDEEFDLGAETRRAVTEIPVLIDQLGQTPHNTSEQTAATTPQPSGRDPMQGDNWPTFPVMDISFLNLENQPFPDEDAWDDDVPVIELTGLGHTETMAPGPTVRSEEFEILVEGLVDQLQSAMARRIGGIVREAIEEMIPTIIQTFNRDNDKELRDIVQKELPSLMARAIREAGELTIEQSR